MKPGIGFVSLAVLALSTVGPSSVQAAVQGTVLNITTGKPQAGAAITMVELGAGMKNVGSTKTDAEGKFTFDVTTNASTPYLVQAVFESVTYNKMLPPGAAATPVTLEVYNAAAKVPEAKVSQHMILLERSAGQMVINETIIFANSGATTFQDPGGTLRIQVPAQVTGIPKMRIAAPGGMPISREPEKGKDPGTWVVRYPIKPGETRFDFSYTMPAAGDATNFTSRILHTGGPVRIIAPQGLKLESAALTDLGPEPRTQATVFELKGREFAINVSGIGQLRSAASEEAPKTAAAEGSSEESANDTPGIDMVKPRIYQRMPWVVGLTFGMLTVGFLALYNKGARA